MRATVDTHPNSSVLGTRHGQHGLTLVELLVAIAVLAVLASVSFRGLKSILDADAYVLSETRRWNDVALVAANMSRDITLAVARNDRDDAGGVRAGLVIDWGQDESQGRLLITRIGDSDGEISQSDLRMVGYQLLDKTLDYVIWPAVDLAPGATPTVSHILENVSALRLRAIDQDGTWTPVWPAGGKADVLPRAIEVQIELETGDRITRIFSLR